MDRLYRMAIIAVTGVLLLTVHVDAGNAQAGPDGESAHVHISLGGLPDAADLPEVEGLAEVMARDGFFDSSAAEGDHLWTPCSVLSAAILGTHWNAFWQPIEQNGRTDPPSLGTNILGKFDGKLKDGRIPRQDAVETSEILARLAIWRSGGINIQLNTLLSGWTQRQCLGVLLKSGPNYVFTELQKIGTRFTGSHHPSVKRWSATLNLADLDRDLAELRDARFLTTKPTSAVNPLTPCSLLVAKRLGTSLNVHWSELLQGSLQPPFDEFAEDLKNGTVPGKDPAKAALAAALLFRNTIGAADIVSTMFASESTHEQCLDEIFKPGSIRARLTREGKLPLRKR
jgi:hypothetical protein